MNSELWRRAREVFEESIELAAKEREAAVTEGCGQDLELESYVRELIDAHEREGDELDPVTHSGFDALLAGGRGKGATQAIPGAPSRIASYQLLRRVGVGGMGSVYEAIQDEPKRTVALKVMREGLSSEFAIKRFRLEAELLARLQHANVARVLDAGSQSSDDGTELPWIALDFVEDAATLTEFAERRSLSRRARVDLFIQACEGVQHGHQKGIIHRDLKASNILVGSDGVPKVIDFGIASVVDGDSGDSTRLTLAGEIVGTLGLMSPEQLDGRVEDLDVRSDVYSLGALLFELLSGEPAYDIANTPLPQAIERVRTQDPRRLRVVCVDIEPELEWIVQRAMATERDQRYATASELAADLGRYLAHQPVLASPPSAVYVLSKFVRRHRFAVSAAAASIFLLIGALVWISSLYSVANAERNKFEAINHFMGQALYTADPGEDGPETRVVDVLGRVFGLSASMFPEQPDVRASLLGTVGTIYTSLGEYKRSRAHLEQSVELFRELHGPESTDAYLSLSKLGLCVMHDEQNPVEAASILREALAGLTAAFGPDDRDVLNTQSALGQVLSEANQDEEAGLLLRGAYESSLRLMGEVNPFTAHYAGRLAQFQFLMGELEEAEQLTRRLVEVWDELTGPEHVDALHARNNHAGVLLALGRAQEGLDRMRVAHAGISRIYGPTRPQTYRTSCVLGQVLIGAGQLQEAEQLFEDTLAGTLKNFGPSYRLTLDARLGLGTARYFLGNMSGAEEELRLTIEGQIDLYGELDDHTLSTRNNLAMMLQAAGQTEEAEELLWINLEARRELHPGDHPDTLRSINNLGFLLLKAGRFDEAAPLIDEALEGRRTLYGHEHPETLNSTSNAADLRLQTGRAAESIPLWREVLRLGPEAYGKDSPRLEFASSGLERALQAAGE